MGKIILGLVGCVLGSVFVIKSESFLQMTGRIPWAEAHLGMEGGTRLLYKLIGIIIILLSFLYMTGLGTSILKSILAPLFGGMA